MNQGILWTVCGGLRVLGPSFLNVDVSVGFLSELKFVYASYVTGTDWTLAATASK